MRIPTPLAQVLRGFAMGSADIVPGVSGGTVALVLGIYDRLIRNVRAGAGALRPLLTGDLTEFRTRFARIEWGWILTLLAGVVLAIGALSRVIEHLLEDHPVKVAGLFLGLVVASVYVAWRQLDRLDGAAIGLMVGVAVALFLLLGLRTETAVADGTAEVVTQPLWAFFFGGAIAICAMILPGISGSFILVLLGMYTEVLGAVNDRDIVSLLAFVSGCVVGLALFSTLLNWLLEEYHHLVIAAMIGLMLGSTRVLWPWPNGVDTTTLALPRDDVFWPIALAIIGAAAVLAVERISRSDTPADTATPARSRS